MRQAVSHTCVYVSAWAQGIEIPPFVFRSARPGVARYRRAENNNEHILSFAHVARVLQREVDHFQVVAERGSTLSEEAYYNGG